MTVANSTSFVDTCSVYANDAYKWTVQNAKDGYNWSAHHITVGYKEYLVPLFMATIAVLRQGYGVSAISALVGLHMLKSLTKDNDPSRLERVVKGTVTAACFVLAGYAFTFGHKAII